MAGDREGGLVGKGGSVKQEEVDEEGFEEVAN